MGIKTEEKINKCKANYRDIPMGGLWKHEDGKLYIKTDLDGYSGLCSIEIKTGKAFSYEGSFKVISMRSINKLEVEEI